MAKLAPPKKDKSPTVVSAPKPIKILQQAAPDAIKPIQLKIPESSKNEFKAYAAMRGLAMNELFLQMFDEYKENNS